MYITYNNKIMTLSIVVGHVQKLGLRPPFQVILRLVLIGAAPRSLT